MWNNKNIVYKISPEISIENIIESIFNDDDEYKKEVKYLRKFASSQEYINSINLLRKESLKQKTNINEEIDEKLNTEQYNLLLKTLKRIEENYKNIYKTNNEYSLNQLSENLIMDYRVNETFNILKKDKNNFLKNFKEILKTSNLDKETLLKNQKRYTNIKNTSIRESQLTISY